jgi:hypothetical protein
MGMRAAGGCVAVARGGGDVGGTVFCCAAAKTGRASRTRAETNAFLKWITPHVPMKRDD